MTTSKKVQLLGACSGHSTTSDKYRLGQGFILKYLDSQTSRGGVTPPPGEAMVGKVGQKALENPGIRSRATKRPNSTVTLEAGHRAICSAGRYMSMFGVSWSLLATTCSTNTSTKAANNFIFHFLLLWKESAQNNKCKTKHGRTSCRPFMRRSLAEHTCNALAQPSHTHSGPHSHPWVLSQPNWVLSQPEASYLAKKKGGGRIRYQKFM